MKLNVHKINLILAEREMTRADLGKAAGISRQNISTILTRGTCETKTAGRIAKGLNVEVCKIVKEE